ncbi:hypothetical protein O181_078436 [Austropuccinia psidii MF-1]|uniref:Anaphase-promoting complex subunit 4-like WD40 domain-containing protein n=1 Tax=Austropuccinia psidii MF-1 TaxID=1389203 RepID=A0A9Q3ID20_9BASI|nr:hypothetical protein [Austropuccinia psidii MF-1]
MEECAEGINSSSSAELPTVQSRSIDQIGLSMDEKMESAESTEDQWLPEGEGINEEDVLEVIELNKDDNMTMLEEDDVEEDHDAMITEEDDNQGGLDDSIIRFSRHSQPVFCIATHPCSTKICASGGADDLGYIWDISTGQELLQLSGHSDSLSSIEFSHDGHFLATGGVDGKVKIWQNSDQENFLNWQFLLDLEASDEVTWLSWHPKGLVLLAGCFDGMIYMWQIPSGATMHVFAGHDSMTTCGTFTPDGKTIVSGSESSVLIIWDPKSGVPRHKINLNEGKYSFKMDEEQSGINSLVINEASTICVVGGISNGGVRLLNLQTGMVIGGFDEHENTATIEVGIYEATGLGVTFLVSGGTDGLACIYDASTLKPRASVRHEGAITSLAINKELGKLTTGSLDKTIVTWDLRTGQREKMLCGHEDIIHMVKLTQDLRFLISCSDDGNVLVYEV